MKTAYIFSCTALCPMIFASISNYKISEVLDLDIPNLDDDSVCSLLFYCSDDFPFIIYKLILEAAIKYIRS